MNAVTRFLRSFTFSEKSKSISTQQIRFEPRDPLPQRLKLEPPGPRCPQLAAREQRVLVADGDRFPGAFGEQLGPAAAVHGNEPPECFVDRLASRQEAMIAQNDSLARAQGGG